MTYYIFIFIILIVGFSIIGMLFNKETGSSSYQQELNDMLSFLKQQNTSNDKSKN